MGNKTIGKCSVYFDGKKLQPVMELVQFEKVSLFYFLKYKILYLLRKGVALWHR